MNGIVDVAAYVLHQYGPMTTMKLQKLTFYSQAQSLALRDCPLFPEDFQAWRGGPVSPILYGSHRGKFLIRDGELDLHGSSAAKLGEEDRRVVDSVCRTLIKSTGNQLSARTHSEAPWKDARGKH